ncbi:MAG: chemotaxis protein CheA [Thermodesulfovibrionales bacterium]
MSDGMEEIIAEFVTEAEESLDKIDPLFVELEARGHDRDLLNDIFRSMHTIKGAAGFLGFQQIVDVAHSVESIMKTLRDDGIPVTSSLMNVILKSVDVLKSLLGHIRQGDGKPEDTGPILAELEAALSLIQAGGAEGGGPGDGGAAAPAEAGPQEEAGQQAAEQAQSQVRESIQTLRVDVDRIDKVMNLAGEIVLVRNRLLSLANYLEERYPSDEEVSGLQEAVSFLDLVTSDMQLAVMKMRMQPIKKVFSKFPRLVRDISANLGKEVTLNISGEETEVDRSVIERIGDPMVHIIRNAIDHGLEPRDERARKGKPPKGRVDISAYQKGSHIIIEVSDDGKGIDIGRVKEKAVSQGLIGREEAERMSDEAASNLIFLPGFSTMETATELSGRGVGMDVVKTNISKLNGYIEVISARDVGTTLRISIPLTLAIIQALMVRAGGMLYAVPLGPIEETIKVSREQVEDIAGNSVLTIRGRVHPVAELTDVLGFRRQEVPEHRYVLVVAVGDRRFCVGVDELLGQEEVVIKTIDGIDTEATGTLGATITGDGRIVLILDPSAMSKRIVGMTKV